jgi:hypothetical protein
MRLGRLDVRLGDARLARRPLSSSRAMTWPFSTRTPSSISTSVSVPVIWVETVAWRRAVM